ncbi:hypothetical protein QBC46DRAFT_345219 [Diplogelasinospora grovesii]|uniref:Uncharacterized protein n=1 Tax=Diplogelasinospora grovesii TaxID=303347 RepID=A0AAN6S1Y1_9PEZI|nr:hypothetical protein QBC46DRAFT_345219 [Diplogelasinospora grovesii]
MVETFSFLLNSAFLTFSGLGFLKKTKPWLLQALSRHKYTPGLTPLQVLYAKTHSESELSRREVRAASFIATHLRDRDFIVHERIGGYGVAGVPSNGPGPVVLLRAAAGCALGVDWHRDCRTRDTRAALRPWWLTVSTTRLIGVKPDVVMARHLMPIPSGSVSVQEGPILVSADIVRIRLYSSKGYRAKPPLEDPEKLGVAREHGKVLAIIPMEHSPFNAPPKDPTLETGIHALSLAALSVLRGANQDTP